MSESSEIAKKLGSLGGKATAKKHPKSFYQNLAATTNAKRAAKKKAAGLLESEELSTEELERRLFPKTRP